MVEGRDGDPSRWRVSDSERHVVAEALREAAGEGRIDLTELLEERLEATYAAKTYADLVPPTADLPAHQRPRDVVAPRPARPPVLGPAYSGSFAMMAETRRAGVWQVGASHWAFALMGSVVIDLRHAQFHSREVSISANALMGSVEVIVNPFTHVVVDGIGVMGDFNEGRSRVEPTLGPDSPVVTVRGLALMGSVQVKRRHEPPTGRGYLFVTGDVVDFVLTEG